MSAGVVRETRSADEQRLAIDWFLGRNDDNAELMNTETGGDSDVLGPTGCSENDGAVSTLAMLLTIQRGRQVPGPAHAR